MLWFLLPRKVFRDFWQNESAKKVYSIICLNHTSIKQHHFISIKHLLIQSIAIWPTNLQQLSLAAAIIHKTAVEKWIRDQRKWYRQTQKKPRYDSFMRVMRGLLVHFSAISMYLIMLLVWWLFTYRPSFGSYHITTFCWDSTKAP